MIQLQNFIPKNSTEFLKQTTKSSLSEIKIQPNIDLFSFIQRNKKEIIDVAIQFLWVGDINTEEVKSLKQGWLNSEITIVPNTDFYKLNYEGNYDNNGDIDEDTESSLFINNLEKEYEDWGIIPEEIWWTSIKIKNKKLYLIKY